MKNDKAIDTSTYTCSQAKIIAERGNTMQADIMQAGDTLAERLFNMRDEQRQQYWLLHGKIASHGFSPGSDQIDAVAKLGQLAMALKALDAAYSAANSVRCW